MPPEPNLRRDRSGPYDGCVSPSVLFIGLGNMGGPMAIRLLDAGYSLAVADIREDALAPFVRRGVATGTHPPSSRAPWS